MTKKWLSLVLVLTLIASLFTGTAMAAPVMKGTAGIAFVAASPTAPLVAEAGKNNTLTIGTLYTTDDGAKQPLSAADYAALLGKLGIKEATTIASGSVVVNLTTSGTVSITFMAVNAALAKTV
ncbi:MAG: hypothetical protein RSC90_11285, partial [Clostridia bacterium]